MASAAKRIEPFIIWISLVGQVFTHLIIDGTIHTFGLLYLEFIDIYDEGPWITGLLATIFAVVVAGSDPFLGMIIDRYGSWKVLCAGGIFGCAGLIVCAYAPNIYTTYIGYGVFLAIAMASGFVGSTTTVTNSFVYNRTLALGITYAGGSVGTMVYPLLFQAVVPKFTIKGFLMVNAGLFLNMTVVGLLVYTTVKRKNNGNKIGQSAESSLETHEETQNYANVNLDSNSIVKLGKYNNNSKLCCKNFQPKFSVFLTVKALSLFLWYFTYIFTMFGYLMYFPPYAKDLGLAEIQIIILLSIYGAMDLVSRVGVGVLGGFRRINIYILVTVNMTIVGVLTILLPSLLTLASSYNVLLGHVIIFGLLGGGLYGLLGSIAFNAVGEKLAGTAIGIADTFFGVALALAPVIYGSLKESTDSYIMVPYLSGASALLCAVVVQIGQIHEYYKYHVADKSRFKTELQSP